MKKTTFNAILFAGITSVVVYIDGFLSLLHGLTKAGQYNPTIAVLVTGGVIALFLARRRLPAWVLYALSATLLLMVTLAARGDSEVEKLFRDYIYMALLAISFSVFENNLITGVISRQLFARWLAILVLLIFPMMGILTGMKGYDNRFSGFTLSPPIFANAALLTYLIVRNARIGRVWTSLFFISAVTCIVLSGTRSPLVTLALYEMLLFGSGEVISRNRGVYYVLLILGGAVISLVLVDLYATFSLGHSSSRIFSSEDSDGGSLQTRSAWYLMIINGLQKNYFVGGFGAGAAENLTGYITHFDVLRYWYDYSFFFVLIFFYIIWSAYRRSAKNTGKHKFIYRILSFQFIIGNVILLSMHNIFQSPGMILLFSGYLNYSYMRARGDQ
jgi:hypothetical protein